MAKTNMNKLSNKQVDGLKGKLLEVRRIGAKPIFITVAKTTTMKVALKNANIDTDNVEVKIGAQKAGSNSWEEVSLSTEASKYSKIAITTKVSGA